MKTLDEFNESASKTIASQYQRPAGVACNACGAEMTMNVNPQQNIRRTEAVHCPKCGATGEKVNPSFEPMMWAGTYFDQKFGSTIL